MSTTEQGLPGSVIEAAGAMLDEAKKYGSRDSFLARSGKLAEAEVDVDGETWLIRELPGSARNQAIAVLGQGRMQATPVFELDKYQRILLLHGLVDPSSPEGARKPLLDRKDLEAAMGLGSQVLDPLIEGIEQLSALSQEAEKTKQAVDDFLGETPNG
jgi:hypothetical protein